MRSAALRLCPVLLLLFAEVQLGSAAAVKKRADRSDLQKPDLYRRKCPMGTYEANDSIQCLPCKKDEYTEYPNDFPKCLGCRTCREDQVEVSPCIPTRNTQCACKNGTFCLPDHPCEMCQKCQTECPKGQVRLAPCTQHSDLLCGPPLEISSSSSTLWIIITFTVLLAVILGLVLVFWKRCSSRHHGAGDDGELSWKPSAVVNRLLQRLGIQDNRCNEQIYQNQQQQELLFTAQGSEVPHGVEMEGTERRTPDPKVETQRKLVPVLGENPIALLHRSFNTFVDYVPFPEWKRFGRALDLQENDLYLAEQHDRVSCEPFYQMLNTWLNQQGSKASVNTLLETLPRIGLSGVADIIASELISKGYFQYEVS
ncbi:tumor necrosis factor receptor superfamily member 10B precursor [Gallus gallus]|uniref:TvbS1 n=1 Tax=Gallus gallus TaxID=9031 RepID=Q9IAR7_CHICK|nr:tumor necrosis factor receptor superfamily member 10B precursor [Gallus gallus]AAF60221.1 TvbS1 [Gallus gallus]|eukprot:NP_989446.2 tumor necrosis factor receptor superfamily member 10B precursor [Gallus gallus]